MRAFWLFLAFSLVLAFCPAAQADTQALTLNDYRQKALVPAACLQVGGTIIYATHTSTCKLPTITSKIPSSALTATRALPVTTKH
jgi:cytochrome c oxidase assembly factor CtaG